MRLRSALALTLLPVLALTACGTTDAPTTEDTTAPAGEAITVTDARGEEVTLDGPATEVVTLEWSVTEYVASLGVQPVGVADVEGYATWAQEVPLTGEPADVGVRTEPSVDAIAGLEPDLILADTSSIPEDAMEQIERIAPVVVLESATTDGLFDLVQENQRTVGTLLGKEAEAEALAEDFDTALTEAEQTIADAGAESTPMALTYPYVEANSLTFRIHGPGSAPAAVGEAIGLTTASTESGDEAYGLTTSDVEGLRNLPEDTEFLYWADPTTEDPIETLSDNAVWNGLPFVEGGRVHQAADGIWMYGGTVSLGALAHDIARAVTS